MKWYRIWAIIMRHIFQMFRDFWRVANIFYWPFVDIILWGYTGTWMQSGQSDKTEVATVLLVAAIFWQIIVRANFDISWNLLEEIWSFNMMNLFCTPIQLGEWAIASVILALGTLIVMTLFCIGIAIGFYGYNLLSIGIALIPFLISLFLSGVWIGFVASAILVYWGSRIQSLVFMVGWILTPISGVYYSIKVLPHWLQTLAHCFPMVYIFDSMRTLLSTGVLPIKQLGISLGLNALYCILSLFIFKFMFEKSRQKGLARLVD